MYRLRPETLKAVDTFALALLAERRRQYLDRETKYHEPRLVEVYEHELALIDAELAQRP